MSFKLKLFILNKVYIVFNFFKLIKNTILKKEGRGAVAALIKENKILLVEHTYVKGWGLPGGGVNEEESFEDGLKRELCEELNIKVNKIEKEIFTYFRKHIGAKVEIKIFLVKDFDYDGGIKSKFEIKSAKFFDLDNLPKDTIYSLTELINTKIL